MDIKVSVIVVTYNHGPWLAECLESILDQNVSFPIEILVGDDASTDGLTQSILIRFAHRHPNIITPVLRERNIGFDNNEFDLSKRSTGTYIARIDGDDLMLPGKLQIQAETLYSNPGLSLIAHAMLGINSNRPLPTKLQHLELFTTETLLKHGSAFANSSVMYRRSMQRVEHRVGQYPTVDFLLHIDRLLHGPGRFINMPLGKYRENAGISTNPGYARQIAHSYLEAYNYAERNGVMLSHIAKLRSRRCVSLALRALLNRNQQLHDELISLYNYNRCTVHKLIAFLIHIPLYHFAARIYVSVLAATKSLRIK